MLSPLLREDMQPIDGLHLPHPEAEQSRTLRQCSWIWQWFAQHARRDAKQRLDRARYLCATATALQEKIVQLTTRL
jgi:hypothetical protein